MPKYMDERKELLDQLRRWSWGIFRELWKLEEGLDWGDMVVCDKEGHGRDGTVGFMGIMAGVGHVEGLGGARCGVRKGRRYCLLIVDVSQNRGAITGSGVPFSKHR